MTATKTIETGLHVQLLGMTGNALDMIYAACRQCYSSEFAGDIFESDISNKKKEGFIAKIVASGHESPLEHVKFTFAVEGVSRALTHQLVRHRIASFSQQSQRYVNENDFNFIVPPSIQEDPKLNDEFRSLMLTIRQAYRDLVKGLEAKGIAGEKANQDARFVLPQAAETKIVVTMNARELIHFFAQRCCSRAQWEIRIMAEKMLEICRDKLESVFKESGEKCVSLGYCPEGEKFSCGRYPLKKDFLNPENTKHAAR